MGGQNQERIRKIKAGEVLPLSATQHTSALRYRRCGKCGHLVTDSGSRAHIRECWGTDIKDTDPIPTKVPTLRSRLSNISVVRQSLKDLMQAVRR